MGTGKCSFNFDGKGVVVGHGFFADKDECREIHLDMEDWYDGFDNVENIPEGKTSLLWTLAHEIGHILGLEHSGDQQALMYPFYGNSKLGQDDIIGIQYLFIWSENDLNNYNRAKYNSDNFISYGNNKCTINTDAISKYS